jgi:hypothetical protein
MISAPISIRSSGDSVLTEACVPTGMNTGVLIAPCEVVIRPSLPEDTVSLFIKEKENAICRKDAQKAHNNSGI